MNLLYQCILYLDNVRTELFAIVFPLTYCSILKADTNTYKQFP